MKKSIWIIAIITLIISSCTSQKQATSYVNDDVYNSSSKQDQVLAAPSPTQTQGAQVITSPDNAAARKPASSTLEDDYNDYTYANRIERFSNKDTTVGYFKDSNSGFSSDGNQYGNDPNVNISFGIGAGYGNYYSPPYSYGMW